MARTVVCEGAKAPYTISMILRFLKREKKLKT